MHEKRNAKALQRYISTTPKLIFNEFRNNGVFPAATHARMLGYAFRPVAAIFAMDSAVKMGRCMFVWALLFVLAGLTRAWSQEQSAEQPAGSEEPTQTISVTDQQTDSSADQAPPDEGGTTSSQPGFGLPNSRTLLNLGITFNTSALIAPVYLQAASYQEFSASHLYGTLQYQRRDRRFQTAVDYKAGGVFHLKSYNNTFSDSHIQQLTASETITGRRATFLIEDAMNDAPGGNFGDQAFGTSSATNPGNIINPDSNFFGFNYFGGLGQTTLITNVSLAQLRYELTPRSSVAVTGSYALAAYLGNSDLISSRQVSGAVSYGYELTQRSGLSLGYGFQEWRFPYIFGDPHSTAHGVQIGYNRQLTPRLSAGASGGAQFVGSTGYNVLTLGPVQIPIRVTSSVISTTSSGILSYSMNRTSFGLTYNHLITGGSGYFEGAKSDVALLSASQQIWHYWGTSVDAGFARLSNLGRASAGIIGSTYEYVFAGFAVSRPIGRHFRFTGSYQFNDNSLENTACSAPSECGLGLTHVFLLGISWHSSPVRVD